MSIYAYVNNNEIVEYINISDTLYSSWIETNNHKKDYYKLVIYTNPPSVSNSEIAESYFQIVETTNETTVNQTWIVRSKTPDELRKTWTAYEFLLRFTPQERTAYRNAAKTDDNVADFMSLAQAAQEIINDDSMTIAGMNYLVLIGIITEQRKNEILFD